MPFVQRKLERSVNQTRGIFDKFIYKPENGDTLNDVLVPEYFSDSRFIGEQSIVEAQLSDGYFTLSVNSSGTAQEIGPPSNPGVQSVTGNNVNNDDPENPVILPPTRMSLASTDTITLDGSLATPSYFSGFFALPSNNAGFVPTLTGPSSDQDTGAVVNNTGQTLTMTGLVSIESDTGGFTSAVTVWSEFSPDGINWTPQPQSKRDWSISFIAEGSQTNESAVANWLPGQYLRFAFAIVGGSDVILSNGPVTVNGNQQVDGFSVKWSLNEIAVA